MKPYSEGDLSGLRVLLVEDEYLPAMAIEALLLDLGCDLRGSVGTVQEALAAVEDGALDGAILDLNLRGQRADPVAAALAARGIPFVVLSGYAPGEQPLNGYGNGPHLRKPVSAEALIDAMLRAFAPAGGD